MTTPIPIPPLGTAAQPSWVLPVLLAANFLSLLPPPSTLRALIFTPLIASLIYLFSSTPYDPSDPTISYSVSTLWTLHVRILLLHIRHLTRGIPPEDLYRPSRESPDAPASLPILKRLGWITALFASARHVGFASSRSRASSALVYKPSRTAANRSRTSFIFLYTLPRILACYLILDASRSYILTRPYSPISSEPWANTNPAHAISVQPLIWRLLDTLAFGASAAAGMQIHYHFGGLFTVATGLLEPSDWPPLFGNILDVSSVGDFWAKMWHRMLLPIIALGWEVLGVEGELGKIVAGFGISALGHAVCAWTYSGRVLGKGSLGFFVVNGMIVVMERVIGWKGGKKGVAGWVGRVWVLGLVMWLGAWIADDTMRGGMYAKGAVPGGVVKKVLGLWGVVIPDDV